jgi:alkylated DNA nucleotide flippase Atl1
LTVDGVDGAAGRVLLASRLVVAGEWTTYGDLGLAATGGPAARLVARLAARHPEFANAHRVLGRGGVVVRGPGGDREARRARELLTGEGVVFHGRAADPGQRVSWLGLRGRLLALTQPEAADATTAAVPAQATIARG